MKYLRKIVTLLIAVILAASIAVGLGVIFAVKNVNITLVSYSYEEDSAEAKEKISEFKTQILGKVRGTLIGFVGEDDVAAALDSSSFVVNGCEKVYPCTLNVTVKERRETFAVQSGENFEIYDDNGVHIRTAKTRENHVIVDGASTPAKIKTVAKISQVFKSYFSSLSTVTEKIVLSEASSQFSTDNITFYLRCGIKAEIRDYNVLTSEKVGAVYAKFTSLSGEQKLGGIIYGLVSNGTVTATYNQNG